MKCRVILGFCGLLTVSTCLVGCGPELSDRDLGTVVEEVPKVDGADKPYHMPQLGPEQEDKKTEHDHR